MALDGVSICSYSWSYMFLNDVNMIMVYIECCILARVQKEKKWSHFFSFWPKGSSLFFLLTRAKNTAYIFRNLLCTCIRFILQHSLKQLQCMSIYQAMFRCFVQKMNLGYANYFDRVDFLCIFIPKIYLRK